MRALLLLLSLLATSAHAATHIWTGAAGDAFSHPANWIGGSPVGDADAELVFSSTTGSRTPQNDIDGLVVRAISISAGGYLIGGKPIEVTGEVALTAGTSVIASELVLRGDVVFHVDGNGGQSAVLNLDGAIRGSGRFIRRGSGAVVFRGTTPNSYTGGTVLEGYLRLQKSARVVAIPGDVRIASRLDIDTAEQIADDAVVTFEPYGEVWHDEDETVGSVVALGVGKFESTPYASFNTPVGRARLFVKSGEMRAIRRTRLDVFVHLSRPLTVFLEDGASILGAFDGDAPLTVRSNDPQGIVILDSSHFSPTTIENAASTVELPNSPVVQRGGSFTGKAASLRLEGVALASASIGGPLTLDAASTVYVFQRETIAHLSAVGPVRLNGARLIGGPLERRPVGTVIPVLDTIQGVIGTFAGLPEGGMLDGYAITYRGGDGNDVELRSVVPPSAQIRTTQTAVDSGVRLTFTVDFFNVRANGTLAIREDDRHLANVAITNGTGTIDLALPPGYHELDVEYLGDPALAPAKERVAVSVVAPIPVVTSMEPTVIRTSQGEVTLTIRGANFIPSAQVYIDHQGYPTEYVSPTELRWVATSLRRGQAARTVQVFVEQDPGSRRSNPIDLRFEAGPPVEPKRLTIAGNAITATVRPGATVAMMLSGYHALRTDRTMLADADSDGKVTWQVSGSLPRFFVVAVVDVGTGEVFIEANNDDFAPETRALPVKIHRGPSGAYSNVVIRTLAEPRLLWVRRGAGAWMDDLYYGSPADKDGASNGRILFEAGSMRPLGSSPPAPASMERGDVLIAIEFHDATPFLAVIDDSHIGADVPGTLELPRFAPAYEESGVLRLTLHRGDGSAGIVSARVTTADGTARGGIDYVPFDERVTLGPGEMWKTFEIRLIDDNVYAGTRRFDVRLSEPAGAAISTEETEVQMVEAEMEPVVSVDDVTVVEGDAPHTATTTIRLAGATRLVTVAHWYVSNEANGSVVFGAGETAKQIAIPIDGDRIADGDAKIEISLSAPQANRSSKAGYLTIIDDDVARISVRDVSVTEGNGGRRLEVELDLDITATRNVRVAYATRDVTATAGSDYTATSGHHTFSTHGRNTIEIPILDDTFAEQPEMFEIVLSAPEGGELARSVARVTIADDDAPPVLSILDGTGVEGDRAVFALELSAASPVPVRFNVSIAPGTASASDFAGGNFTITIPERTVSYAIEVTLVGDFSVEPEETFTITLSNPTNATLGRAVATGRILDDVTAPSILSISDAVVEEGDSGTRSVTVAVMLDRVSALTRVRWATADGTATAGTDYVAAQGEVTIGSSNQRLMFVTITVNGDREPEPDETFRIVFSNPTGALLSRTESVVTIVSDDGGERRRSAKK